jgi:hypothetical protein
VKRRTFTILAFLGTPVIPSIIFGVGMAINMFNDSKLALTYVPLFYLYFSIIVVVVVFPAYLIGRKLNLIKWWSVLIIGVLVGAMMSLTDRQFDPARFLVLCGLGFISSLTFWLIWRMGEEPGKTLSSGSSGDAIPN